MKEIACTSRNILFFVEDDPLKMNVKPIVEVVIVVSEPRYQYIAGEIAGQRELETLRLCAAPDALRKLAKGFMEWADEADAHGKTLKIPAPVKPKKDV